MYADCYQSSNIHLQACLTTINNWLTNKYLLLNPNNNLYVILSTNSVLIMTFIYCILYIIVTL